MHSHAFLFLQTVQFPAVTICNLNIIRRSFISRFPDANKIMSTFDSFMERPKPGEGGEGGGGGGGGGGAGGGGHGESQQSNSSETNTAPTSFKPPEKRKEAMMGSLSPDSSNAEESASLNNITVDEQAYAEDLILGMLAKHNESELQEGGHHFPELVFRCNWKDFSCKDG